MVQFRRSLGLTRNARSLALLGAIAVIGGVAFDSSTSSSARATTATSAPGRGANVQSSLFGTLLSKKGRATAGPSRTGGSAGGGPVAPPLERFAEVKPTVRTAPDAPVGVAPLGGPFVFSPPFGPAPVPGAIGGPGGTIGGGGGSAPPLLSPGFGGGGVGGGGGGGGGVAPAPEPGQPPVVTPEPPVVTPEPPVVTPPVVTPEPPVVPPVTPEPPVVTPPPPVTPPVTPEPPVTPPVPPVTPPVTPPVVTPPVTPPVVTPPVPPTSPGVPAVPEPSTWLLMIVGFGALGLRLRRRGRADARALTIS